MRPWVSRPSLSFPGKGRDRCRVWALRACCNRDTVTPLILWYILIPSLPWVFDLFFSKTNPESELSCALERIKVIRFQRPRVPRGAGRPRVLQVPRDPRHTLPRACLLGPNLISALSVRTPLNPILLITAASLLAALPSRTPQVTPTFLRKQGWELCPPGIPWSPLTGLSQNKPPIGLVWLLG